MPRTHRLLGHAICLLLVRTATGARTCHKDDGVAFSTPTCIDVDTEATDGGVGVQWLLRHRRFP